MTIDLTQIILAVITLISAVITRFLIPWLIENVEEKKRAKIVDIVCTLVEAADRRGTAAVCGRRPCGQGNLCECA